MGILMRLTNEGGVPPLGDFPINTILILTFRTDLVGRVGTRQEHTETLWELAVADRQMRQAPAFASALVLGRIW